MAIITLAEWARRNGIHRVTAYDKAKRGTIPAEKVGNTWLIDESVENTDHRVKSGNYKNWRKNNATE